MPMAAGGGYPVGLEVDPPAGQSRLTVFFRMLWVLPAFIFLYVLLIVAEVMALITWFVIVITGKLPAGLGDFIANTIHVQARTSGYMLLLTGKYPPFALGPAADYPVRAEITPQYEARNRLTVFFRILMVIPHLIVLSVVGFVAEIVLFIAWIAALVTGSVPAGMHNFLVGVQRWGLRVAAYEFLLVDAYPPFGFN